MMTASLLLSLYRSLFIVVLLSRSCLFLSHFLSFFMFVVFLLSVPFVSFMSLSFPCDSPFLGESPFLVVSVMNLVFSFIVWCFSLLASLPTCFLSAQNENSVLTMIHPPVVSSVVVVVGVRVQIKNGITF